MADSQQSKAQGGNGASAPIVNWDDANMRTSHANVVNTVSTREEVTILFGTNQTWNAADSREFHVQLSNRIVLNPFAAKRLWTLLGGVLKEYEARFGSIAVGKASGADRETKGG